jgi:hypothetical protein
LESGETSSVTAASATTNIRALRTMAGLPDPLLGVGQEQAKRTLSSMNPE